MFRIITSEIKCIFSCFGKVCRREDGVQNVLLVQENGTDQPHQEVNCHSYSNRKYYCRTTKTFPWIPIMWNHLIITYTKSAGAAQYLINFVHEDYCLWWKGIKRLHWHPVFTFVAHVDCHMKLQYLISNVKIFILRQLMQLPPLSWISLHSKTFRNILSEYDQCYFINFLQFCIQFCAKK